MATLTVERHIGTHTAEYPKVRKVDFFSGVMNALWRTSYGFSFSGLFLPVGPEIRHCKALSPREKTEIEAYRMGL